MKKDVADLLPQKVPFVMVDTLYDFKDSFVKSGYTVKSDNVLVEGNQFLEAGLIEHMAQSVALHTGYYFFLRNEKPPMGYIGAISDVKITALPLVGQEVVSEVNILNEFGGVTLVGIVSYLDGVEIASGKMKTVLANE